MEGSQPHRSTYAFVPPASEGSAEVAEELRQEAAPGLARGHNLRIASCLAVVLLVSATSTVAWLGGARRGRTVASLRSRVGLHEEEECKPYEVNVDFRDLRELRQIEKITDSKKCSALCEEAKDCAAWTWGKLRNVIGFSDVCFLKELIPDVKAQKFYRYGAVAGLRSSTSCTGTKEEWPESMAGHIQSRDGLCLKAVAPVAAGSKVAMSLCSDGSVGQDWTYVEKTGQIKNGLGHCLDATDYSKPYAPLQMYPCDTGNWSQRWMFDNVTGLIKNWRGSCFEAQERNVEGGLVLIQTCDVNSTGQRWWMGMSGDQSPVPEYPSGTLYCFALMLPGSYEQGLLAMQHQRGVSLFACEAYSVYSNQVIQVDDNLTSSVVDSDLKCGKGGEFGTALNLDIFLAVWTKVVSDAIFNEHDWTVKVDPDAVFFPQRLRIILRIHPEQEGGVYLNNCQFGLHGPVEVLSRNAVTAWAIGSPHCVQHFSEKCGGDCFWGEDLFLDQCLWKVLGVRRDNDFRQLVEDHCDPPDDWDLCYDSTRAAFHPFKDKAKYEKCLDNAGKPPPETPPPTPAPPTPAPPAPATPTPAPSAVVRVSGPSKSSSSHHDHHHHHHHEEDDDDKDGDDDDEEAERKEHSKSAEKEPEKPGDSDKLRYTKPKKTSRAHCRTAEPDTRCYIAVKWAMDYGIRLHPEWYEGLDEHSTWSDFQEALHGRPHINCPMPCKDEASDDEESDREETS